MQFDLTSFIYDIHINHQEDDNMMIYIVEDEEDIRKLESYTAFP